MKYILLPIFFTCILSANYLHFGASYQFKFPTRFERLVRDDTPDLSYFKSQSMFSILSGIEWEFSKSSLSLLSGVRLFGYEFRSTLGLFENGSVYQYDMKSKIFKLVLPIHLDYNIRLFEKKYFRFSLTFGGFLDMSILSINKNYSEILDLKIIKSFFLPDNEHEPIQFGISLLSPMVYVSRGGKHYAVIKIPFLISFVPEYKPNSTPLVIFVGANVGIAIKK